MRGKLVRALVLGVLKLIEYSTNIRILNRPGAGTLCRAFRAARLAHGAHLYLKLISTNVRLK